MRMATLSFGNTGPGYVPPVTRGPITTTTRGKIEFWRGVEDRREKE
jgi:hypothetical protein